MTGPSIPWKMSPEQLKRFKEYCKKPVSAMLIGGGSCLLLEHLFEYGGFDLLDFWGHETLGMIMIGAGVLLSMKWGQWKSLNLKNPYNWWR